MPTAFDPSGAVLAIGALGTASFALVDTTKALWGGVSRCGFSHIVAILTKLFPESDEKKDKGNPVAMAEIKDVLLSNWLNGKALTDQKSIAKTLIKLRLDTANAPHLAKVTGVDAVLLTNVAQSYVTGGALTAEEQNVAGRFDVILSSLLDEGYQRADQVYRNSAKSLAVVFSVLLAFGGWYALPDPKVGLGVALFAGFLAAPLAPVSKDLASALQASVKMLQAVKS